MFYFTCNESKIYESFTFWNKLQEKTFSWHSNVMKMHLYIQTEDMLEESKLKCICKMFFCIMEEQ